MQTKPLIQFPIVDDHDLYLIFLYFPYSAFLFPVVLPEQNPQNDGIIAQFFRFVYLL